VWDAALTFSALSSTRSGDIIAAMEPEAIGRSYDALAHTWQDMPNPRYGMASLNRALTFAPKSGAALDIGCGSQGRMIDLLLQRGFQVEGVDVSAEMIALARERHPTVVFHHADISAWDLPRECDFICAWDSVWHLPMILQEPVLKKICAGLAPGGVCLFTAVGFDEPGDHGDSGHMGAPLAYGTLGVPGLLELLSQCDCIPRHLEYDQYPELHLVVIAQKKCGQGARGVSI
jgi:SAM-dependent methyltransferase